MSMINMNTNIIILFGVGTIQILLLKIFYMQGY
ncbi:hypothetical protein M0804_008551 [Polistes exclamans]|nr:hypothetical protein M0804_008551 [Polistes exclamans]